MELILSNFPIIIPILIRRPLVHVSHLLRLGLAEADPTHRDLSQTGHLVRWQ